MARRRPRRTHRSTTRTTRGHVISLPQSSVVLLTALAELDREILEIAKEIEEDDQNDPGLDPDTCTEAELMAALKELEEKE